MRKIAVRHTALIVLGIIFVLWNILVWSCVDWKTVHPNVFFYCGYAFICLSFVLVGCLLALYRIKKNVIFSVLMPSYIVTAVYFVVNFVFNTVLMCMPEKDNLKVAIIPNAVILLLFFAAIVVCYIPISHIGNNNDVVDQKVYFLKTLGIEVGQIAAIATDLNVKQSLTQLREEIDFSDPMGVDITAEIEKELVKCVAEIRMLVEGNYDIELIKDKITFTSNKLRQRNELLRAGK